MLFATEADSSRFLSVLQRDPKEDGDIKFSSDGGKTFLPLPMSYSDAIDGTFDTVRPDGTPGRLIVVMVSNTPWLEYDLQLYLLKGTF